MVKRTGRYIAAFSFCAACCVSAAAAAEVKEVKVTGKADDVRIEVTADFPIRYTYYTMPGPPRGIIHIIGAQPGAVEPVTLVNEGPLSRVLVMKRDLKVMLATRIVAELRKDVDLVAETSDASRKLIISFAPAAVSSARGASSESPKKESGKAIAPVSAAEPATPAVRPAKNASFRAKVAAKQEAGPLVREVKVNGGDVEIVGNGLDVYKSFTLDGPNRLVLDFPKVRNDVAVKKVDLPHSKVRRCRIGEIPGRLRLVFDFIDGSAPRYIVDKIDSGLRVRFP